MNLTVNGRLKYKDDGYVQRLILKIKFKLPNTIFSVRLRRPVASSYWINRDEFITTYLNYEHFQEDVLLWLKDQERVKEEVEKMVHKHINGKFNKNSRKSNERKIKELIKNSSFKIDINIEEK